MSDREVKRLTPNSIANLVMADEAWHDSLYVKAEDYDSLLADFEALRKALAAEQPKPEPVRCNPAAMRTAASSPAVLFITELDSPEDEALRRDAERLKDAMRKAMAMLDKHEPEPAGAFAVLLLALNPELQSAKNAAPPATHPGYVIGSHWLETAYSRICAGEAEADVLRDCGWERVDEALRRDAERYKWVLNWLWRYGLLSREKTRIDTPESFGDWFVLRKPHSIGLSVGYGKTEDAAIDAAMKRGDKT